jgi:hypothetical protein
LLALKANVWEKRHQVVNFNLRLEGLTLSARPASPRNPPTSASRVPGVQAGTQNGWCLRKGNEKKRGCDKSHVPCGEVGRVGTGGQLEAPEWGRGCRVWHTRGRNPRLSGWEDSGPMQDRQRTGREQTGRGPKPWPFGHTAFVWWPQLYFLTNSLQTAHRGARDAMPSLPPASSCPSNPPSVFPAEEASLTRAVL